MIVPPSSSSGKGLPPRVESTDALAAALEYAELGYPALPVAPGSKIPARAARNGVNSASANQMLLGQLFAPGDNVGIAWPAGVLAIDLDVPKNLTDLAHASEYADRFAAEYERRFPELARSPLIRSRSGGLVYVIRLPDGITASSKVAVARLEGGGQLDLRGDGRSYVVAPPSVVAPGRYVWERPLVARDALPVASDALLQYLQLTPQSRAVSNEVPHEQPQFDAAAVPNWATRVLAEQLNRVQNAVEGTRNDTLNRAAFLLGQILGSGYLDEHVVRKALFDAATSVGLPYAEADSTIRRGVADGQAQPRIPTDPFVDPVADAVFDSVVDATVEPPAATWDGPEPQPFPVSRVPLLPEGLLPEPLNEWAQDAAKRASVRADNFVPGLIVTLSAIVGNKWCIKPKKTDSSWVIVPNVWGGLVMPPGSMKSPVLNATMKFIRKIEAEEIAQYEAVRVEYEAAEQVLKIQISELEKSIAASFKKGIAPRVEEAKLIDAKRKLEAARHRPPQIVANDVTTEKLVELLRDNSSGLMVFRDELAAWFELFTKQGREGDRQFYLEAHSGDQPYTQQRIGRGTIIIPQVTLSVLGGIQPARLRALQAGAAGADADGLLQRFQILVWPTLPPYAYDDREEDVTLTQKMTALYRLLRQLTPTNFLDSQGKPVTFPADQPFVLKFAPDAQRMFVLWLAELERMIREPETAKIPAWKDYLGKIRSLMPSIALLFHLVDMVTRRTKCLDVSPDAVDRASVLTAYLMGHAMKIYGVEGGSAGQTARLIAAKVAVGAIRDGQTVREIYNAGWGDLDRQAVQEGLEHLTKLGWVRIERSTTPAGGRPSAVVRLHPRASELAQAELAQVPE